MALGNGRYRLKKEGDIVTIEDDSGVVMAGTIERVHELATVLNRFLLYGETADDEPLMWLSTGDAVALSQQQPGGPGKDAIRHAARNGRFVAEKDASGRWRYERASFVRWLADDAAHRPGRKE